TRALAGGGRDAALPRPPLAGREPQRPDDGAAPSRPSAGSSGGEAGPGDAASPAARHEPAEARRRRRRYLERVVRAVGPENEQVSGPAPLSSIRDRFQLAEGETGMPQPAHVPSMREEGVFGGRRRSESGQVIVLVVLGLAVLLGAAALVVDLGYAYTAQRHLQTTADSAALAGAQGLPDVDSAVQLAQEYGGTNKNAHAILGDVDENISTTCVEGSAGCAPDAVVVNEVAHPKSFLAKLFGVSGFTVSVKSAACLDTTSGQAILIGSSYHGTGCAIPTTSNPDTGVSSNPPGGGGSP